MKSLINHTIKIISLFLLININILAQQDSLLQNEPAGEKNNQEQDSVFVMSKSPWGAVLRSAVVPGWGQIYNESYWKAPVVWGIAAWLVYNWIDNNNLYHDNRENYIIAFYSDDPSLRDLADDYKENRNFYRDQRDLFSIYMGLAYVLNLVDAYVDAHLFDFTIEENFYTKQPMLGVRLKF